VPATDRILAIDWMRGLVMVLMAIDHASAAFNEGRVASDSWFLWAVGTELPKEQFLTRWITHLCAPTFVFLAGTSLALSVARRERAGQDAATIDLRLLQRGGVLLLLELLWFSPLFYLTGAAPCAVLQVLWVLGASFVAAIGFRRLPEPLVLLLGLGLLVGHEAFSEGVLDDPSWPVIGAVEALLLAPGFAWGGGADPRLFVLYPLVPWVAMMMLGWTLGRALLRRPVTATARRDDDGRLGLDVQLVVWGLAGLALFVFVRDVNDYGNFRLVRDGAGLLEWLHVSKYPPSLSFAALELGIMAILLGLALRWEASASTPPSRDRPLLVFGQAALFFYVVHIHALELSAFLLGMQRASGLGVTFLAAALLLLVLYPACRWFRARKAPDGSGLLRWL